jgi:CRP/FNR family transcriptional regulator
MDKPIAEKIERFFSNYPAKSYRKGQILIYRGEEPAGVFFIVSGRVKQYDVSDEGHSVVVNIYKPFNFFPMQWAINKTTNQYFFETITSVKLHQAPAEDAVNFIKENADVMFNLLSRVYSGLDGILRRSAHLMASKANIRILFELITECKRFAQKQKDGSYIIPMHAYELADTAGLSRETVSRELVALKKAGLISVNRRHIIIRDLTKLETELSTHL